MFDLEFSSKNKRKWNDLWLLLVSKHEFMRSVHLFVSIHLIIIKLYFECFLVFNIRLLSTSRYNPIHLWDAYSGQLVCTYRAYNYADEVIAAHSIAFSLDGTKIYCGFEKSFRIFDTCFPGRQCLTKATFGIIIYQMKSL